MKDKQVDKFEKVETQLNGLYDEVKALAAKAADGVMNKFKLNHINAIIEEANGLFSATEKPFNGFTRFDIDDIPTNSDVLLVLKQYANCLEQVRASNITQNSFDDLWYWVMEGRRSSRRARPPAKLSGK